MRTDEYIDKRNETFTQRNGFGSQRQEQINYRSDTDSAALCVSRAFHHEFIFSYSIFKLIKTCILQGSRKNFGFGKNFFGSDTDTCDQYRQLIPNFGLSLSY